MPEGPHKLDLTESTSEGLDIIKKMNELGVKLEFQTWDDVEEFEDYLNGYDKEQREGRSYRAKPSPHLETVPSDQ
jgi:hypothetical protein